MSVKRGGSEQEGDIYERENTYEKAAQGHTSNYRSLSHSQSRRGGSPLLILPEQAVVGLGLTGSLNPPTVLAPRHTAPPTGYGPMQCKWLLVWYDYLSLTHTCINSTPSILSLCFHYTHHVIRSFPPIIYRVYETLLSSLLSIYLLSKRPYNPHPMNVRTLLNGKKALHGLEKVEPALCISCNLHAGAVNVWNFLTTPSICLQIKHYQYLNQVKLLKPPVRILKKYLKIYIYKKKL